MKFLLILFFYVLFCYACKTQADNGKTYNETYTVSEIPDLNAFHTLTEYEKSIDSMYSSDDIIIARLISKDSSLKTKSLFKPSDFINNRGRIVITYYENGNVAERDSIFQKGLPTQCKCEIDRDSIFVSMAAGFFSGFGYTIMITKNSFNSNFFIAVNDIKPFKKNLADSFTNELNIKSKYQYLVLDQRPSYQEGQQLTGYFTTTSENYYENSIGDTIDSNYVVGKIYFTCTTINKFK